MPDVNSGSASALLFDLNGTMIDDMSFHTRAWFEILNHDLGKRMSLDEVAQHMYGTNEELLIRVFGPDHFSDEQMESIAMKKERRYQEAFRPHLSLINGLGVFIQRMRNAGRKIGLGTAAIPFNVDFVLDNLNIREHFDAIVTANDVQISKPDPETYLRLAAQLGVLPQDCVVFEDSPQGMEAAFRAGMPGVVITTSHAPDHFRHLPNILLFVNDYTNLSLRDLLAAGD